jgi:hypothetical protein
MPPQPLSSYRNCYKYTRGSNALENRPALAALMAQTIAVWAEVEVALGELLCEALEASAGPFAAAYQALNSSGAQNSVAVAAIRYGLDEAQGELFEAIMMVFRTAKKDRDRIAHGTWGWSEQLPDALLLTDPKIRMRSRAAMQPWKMDGDLRTSHGNGPESVIKNTEVFVYKEDDFKDVKERFHRVEAHLTRFTLSLIKDWPKASRIPRQLSSEPDILDALARLRKGNQKR